MTPEQRADLEAKLDETFAPLADLLTRPRYVRKGDEFDFDGYTWTVLGRSPGHVGVVDEHRHRYLTLRPDDATVAGLSTSYVDCADALNAQGLYLPWQDLPTEATA